jgi:hypothetical protein
MQCSTYFKIFLPLQQTLDRVQVWSCRKQYYESYVYDDTPWAIDIQFGTKNEKERIQCLSTINDLGTDSRIQEVL